jgi:hypothetical protein
MHLRRRSSLVPSLALGSAVLWGVIELLALWRSRWLTRTNARV